MSAGKRKQSAKNGSRTDSLMIMNKRFIAPRKTLKSLLQLIENNPDIQEDLTPCCCDEIATTKSKRGRKPGKTGKASCTTLKNARLEAGMTQKELAEKVGINQGLISKMENGSIKVTENVAHELGKCFKSDYKSFLR
ncbi:MAG: helix-turn-helix transcriptional regulator [Oligoflexia bacterium]|nr:helix-turn-helix transcriptional regulator [Oligoflexia bacterium]